MRLVSPQTKGAQIQALEELAFTLEGRDDERKGVRTDGLVIIKNGEIVYEKYARGFDETKRHISWSVAKSMSSALIGVAAAQGALSLDDSICLHLEGIEGDACKIRVRHLLTFGSGLQWQEEYEGGAGYQMSSVISMLFGAGHRDQIRFTLGHKLEAEPGTRFIYSTGEAHVLSTVARNALARAHGKDAFWTQLFDKIGMTSVVMEEDAKGSPLGGSFAYATPRDYARFGYLFLNDGCWAGERILPENWVSTSTTPSDVFRADRADGTRTPNGYMWWLNKALPDVGIEKPWKDAPEDAYTANGHWGQYVVVVPSEDVVIVRTGDDRANGINLNGLIQRALEVAR